MARAILKPYYVFFNDEWHIPEPAYYFVDKVTGRNPKDALKRNLPHLISTVMRILQFGKTEAVAYKLERALHIVPVEHWISAGDAYWQSSITRLEKSV